MSRAKIDFQTLLNSRFGTSAALAVGRGLPSWLGKPLARLTADVLAGRKGNSLVRGLRANLWVATGCTLNSEELDRLVVQTFRRHTRSLWDFYHNLSRPNKVLELVDFSPQFQQLFDQAREDRQPRLILIVHTGNFELAGRSLALRGLDFQILSFPQPPGGYQLQNKIRQESGIESTPMSVEAFQKARDRLRRGGTVLTGVDRPLADSRRKVQFFGRPAPLPVAYVQLALQTGASMVVAACVSKPGGRYEIISMPPVEALSYGERDADLVRNAEAILQMAEQIIRPRPTDWSMFYPIWPEIEKEIPV